MSEENLNINLNNHSSLNDNISTENTKKRLPERKNRGQRMKYLEGKELDDENDFYNNLFREYSSDENFTPKSSEHVDKDSFDSDFDNSQFKSSENDFSETEGLEGFKNSKTKKNHMQKTCKVNNKKKQSRNKVFPNKNKHFKENNKKCSLNANNDNQINNALNENKISIHAKNESNLIICNNPDLDIPTKNNEVHNYINISISNQNGGFRVIDDENEEEKSKMNEKEEEDDEDYFSKKKQKKRPKIKRRITNKNFIDNDDKEDDDLLNKKRQRVKFHRKDNEKSRNLKNNKHIIISNDYSLITVNKGYLKKNIIVSNVNKKVTFKEETKKEKNTDFIKVSNLIREKPSQKDLLYEAIFTEIYNIKSLEDMQRLEELNKRDTTNNNKKHFSEFVKIRKRLSNYVKREPEPDKKQTSTTSTNTNTNNEKENKEGNSNEKTKEIINIIVEQQVEVVEDDGKTPVTEKTLLTFSDSDLYKKIFENFNKKQSPKQAPTCSVSGEKAKYYDPITKQYYSNLENFKILRERYFQKEEDNLLFKIQTLSDLTSQKKERLKKMILSSSQTSTLNNGSNEATNKNILSLVNKYGILKDGEDIEKKIINRKLNYNFR